MFKTKMPAPRIAPPEWHFVPVRRQTHMCAHTNVHACVYVGWQASIRRITNPIIPSHVCCLRQSRLLPARSSHIDARNATHTTQPNAKKNALRHTHCMRAHMYTCAQGAWRSHSHMYHMPCMCLGLEEGGGEGASKKRPFCPAPPFER